MFHQWKTNYFSFSIFHFCFFFQADDHSQKCGGFFWWTKTWLVDELAVAFVVNSKGVFLVRFYFSSCYSLGNRQTIFSCLIKSETNPRRDQTLFLFFALLLWPQGSKAFRICQTLRVFISKMSIRDRRTKKAVHRPASGLAPHIVQNL